MNVANKRKRPQKPHVMNASNERSPMARNPAKTSENNTMLPIIQLYHI